MGVDPLIIAADLTKNRSSLGCVKVFSIANRCRDETAIGVLLDGPRIRLDRCDSGVSRHIHLDKMSAAPQA